MEAFLRHDQIPDEWKHGRGYWPWSQEGGWLRLDPTPAAAEDIAAGWFKPFRQGLDWLDYAWSNYVVELDCNRQRDAVYQPISRLLRKAWQEATDVRRWRRWFAAVAAGLRLDRFRGLPGWLLATMALLPAAAVLAGAVWLLRRMAVWLRAYGAGTARAAPAAAVRKSPSIAVSRRCCPGRGSFAPPARPSANSPWRPAGNWPKPAANHAGWHSPKWLPTPFTESVSAGYL